MFQKFFSDTLMSRFIKNLLAKETIPLLDCVTDGDIVLGGCLYIYKHFVIKCLTPGKLYVSEMDELFPSEDIYPSVMLFPGTGEKPATFKVVAYYSEASAKKFSYHYYSTEHWYDSDTHKHLGNYLRYLRDYKRIDLMPYYNCFNAHEISDVYLNSPTTSLLHPANDLFPDYSLHPGMLRTTAYDSSKDTYTLGYNDAYRVVAVPIKFGKKYTIALECPGTVQLRSVIYNETGMVRVPNTEDQYYSDLITDSYTALACTHFHEPFVYSIETDDKRLYDRQKDLQLLIQMPVSNVSSLVVLEGDYTSVGAVKTDKDSVRTYDLHKNLSLLRMNTTETYAFSDRLIEYLLDNVITHNDEFPTNISSVQQAVYNLDEIYKEAADGNRVSFGVWDDAIRHAVMRIIERYDGNIYFQDQDGFINKDVEDLLLRAGKAYRT